MIKNKSFLLFLLFSIFLEKGYAQNTVLDIRFATVNNIDLKLDLYMPDQKSEPYLVVWVHGGAWHSGTKENPPMDLLKKGYALASIDYRTTRMEKFPAQIHDIKAAVRFLRANADKYKFHSDKIFLWGSSAGGHLVALAGVTNDINNLEGKVGDHLEVSSAVQGIIDFYGPTDLSTIMAQSTPHGIEVRGPALELMFGKSLDKCVEELKVASPVNYISTDDPPLFICHGDQDIQVPINQSIELLGRYQVAHLPVEIEYVYGAGHGGKQFNDPTLINKVNDFLKNIISAK